VSPLKIKIPSKNMLENQLAPADFFVFPHLKSIMKGAGFADVAAIQERVTAVLRSIPKEAFMNVANGVL
jgi:hypothetical protein